MKNKREIRTLKKQIRYEEKRMNVCGYGRSDLLYLYILKEKLAKLENE